MPKPIFRAAALIAFAFLIAAAPFVWTVHAESIRVTSPKNLETIYL